MGIVVSLAMLLGIVFLVSPRFYNAQSKSSLVQNGLVFLVLAGLWNSVWYGLQNLTTFWGLAGLVSGVLTLLAAWIVYKKGLVNTSLSTSTQQLMRILVIVGLALCFALYAITIIQINLGMPIIG